MGYHKFNTLRFGLVSALALTAGQYGAQAQDAEDAPDGARTLGRVTVTAQRREEDLIDVPLSVSAFSGEQLEVTGAVDIQGGSTVVVAEGGNYLPFTSYEVLTAGGGISGTFDGAVTWRYRLSSSRIGGACIPEDPTA